MHLKEFISAIGNLDEPQDRLVVLQVAPGVLPDLCWRLLVDYGIEVHVREDASTREVASLERKPGLVVLGYESSDVRHWRHADADVDVIALVDSEDRKSFNFRLVRVSLAEVIGRENV